MGLRILVWSAPVMSPHPGLSAEQRRVALAALPRASLARLTEHFALLVADRRVAEDHIDALVRARRVDFADLLAQLSRDDPEGRVRALGLDGSGREKQALIDRILGRELTLLPATKGGAAQASAGGRRRRPQRPRRSKPDAGGKADARAAAEGYLWAAADILRGSIDSSDYTRASSLACCS